MGLASGARLGLGPALIRVRGMSPAVLADLLPWPGDFLPEDAPVDDEAGGAAS